MPSLKEYEDKINNWKGDDFTNMKIKVKDSSIETITLQFGGEVNNDSFEEITGYMKRRLEDEKVKAEDFIVSKTDYSLMIKKRLLDELLKTSNQISLDLARKEAAQKKEPEPRVRSLRSYSDDTLAPSFKRGRGRPPKDSSTPPKSSSAPSSRSPSPGRSKPGS